MNESQERLYNFSEEKLVEMAKELRKAGKSDKEIQSIIMGHIKRKTNEYYKSQTGLTSMHDIMSAVEWKKDSNAEGVFYEMLTDAGIKFKFHYKIGPYTADYLIGENIVLELDGPTHTRKDRIEHDLQRDDYMVKKGYHIMRFPLDIVALDPRAAVEEVKSIINGKENETQPVSDC